MIVGEKFVWGHLAKTGGDATAELFALVPDLVKEADIRDGNRKHDTFASRNLDWHGRLFVLNMRRLPCWVVSYLNHVKDMDPRHRIPLSEVYSRTTLPDRLLHQYTDHGRYSIRRWLRMEYLREDVIAFINEELRPLTPAEFTAMRASVTKQRPYDHDVHHWFTREEVARLYASNPLWRDMELQTYGELLLEGDWKSEVKKKVESLHLRARSHLLDSVWRTRGRQEIKAARERLTGELVAGK